MEPVLVAKNLSKKYGKVVALDNAKQFTIKNESGTIELAGYILSTADSLGIA